MNHSWTCRCCGRQFNELPLNFAPAAPDPWLELTEEERSARGRIDSDICVIDHQQFFVRGCLEVPIIGHDTTFVWGVWISVAEPSLLRILHLWDVEVREGAVARLVGIEVGVVSGVFNLESPGVSALGWRLRHEEAYHAA
jgi:hypothetical protein